MEAFWADFIKKFTMAFITGDRWKLYLKGMCTTLELTACALIIGVVLGVLVAVIRSAHDQQRLGRRSFALWVLNFLCKIYTTVIRGTPILVQLLISAMLIFKSSRNRFFVGMLGLGINSGAYVAEIVRGGLMSVDVGQTEAGRSLGLNYVDTMRYIIIPQAFKNILPALGNEFIVLFKDTSLVSSIGAAEVLYYAEAVGSKTYQYMFPYFGVAIMYLVFCIILTWLQGKLERRLRQSDRR